MTTPQNAPNKYDERKFVLQYIVSKWMDNNNIEHIYVQSMPQQTDPCYKYNLKTIQTHQRITNRRMRWQQMESVIIYDGVVQRIFVE